MPERTLSPEPMPRFIPRPRTPEPLRSRTPEPLKTQTTIDTRPLIERADYHGPAPIDLSQIKLYKDMNIKVAYLLDQHLENLAKGLKPQITDILLSRKDHSIKDLELYELLDEDTLIKELLSKIPPDQEVTKSEVPLPQEPMIIKAIRVGNTIVKAKVCSYCEESGYRIDTCPDWIRYIKLD
ncbi:hypothetical protein RUND412_007137 [Rhizina undulata]